MSLARAASEGPLDRRWRVPSSGWAAAVAATTLGLFSLTTLVILGVVGYSPLPLFDAWTPWIDYIALGPGEYASYLFRQHNEHRIVFQRLLNSLDLHLVRADARVPLAAAYVAEAANVLLIYDLAMWRRGGPAAQRVMLLGVLAAIGFSAGQWINVLWTFQASFIAVFTFALATFAAGQRVSPDFRSRRDRWWLVLSLFFAIASTCTMANGLLVWPLLTALAVFRGLPRGVVAVIGATAMVAIAAYLWGFQTLRPLSGSLMKTPELVVFACAYLGSAFDEPFVAFARALGADPEPFRMALSALAGLGGLLLFLHLVREEIADERGQFSVRFALAAHLFFIAGSAAVTALGRVQVLMAEALASRYVTPSLLFWAGLCAWLLTPRPIPEARQARQRVAVFAVAAVLGAAVQLPRVAYGVDAAAYLREGEYVMVNRVFDAGVWERFSGNTGSPDRLLPVVDYFRERRLSAFAAPWTSWLGDPLPRHFDIGSAERCAGEWESSTAAGGEPSTHTEVIGWAYERGTDQPPRRIVFADAAGRIAGFAPITRRRPDLGGKRRDPRGDLVGWATRLAVAPPTGLAAYALLNDDRSLCPIGRRQ